MGRPVRRELILRREPVVQSIESNDEREFKLIQALHERAPFPVPEALWLDLSGEWRLNSHASIYFQGRNIFNNPQRWFESPTIEGQAGALRILESYGANFVFGVKGAF